MAVTGHLEQPTRGFPYGMVGAGRTSPLIWPCSDWGLPCHRCYQRRGGLLPHLFTLTRIGLATSMGGVFSVALSVAFRRPGVTWQSTLWGSDFPRTPCGTRDHPTRPAWGKISRLPATS